MKRMTRIVGAMALVALSFHAGRSVAANWVIQAASGHLYNGTGLGGGTMSDGKITAPNGVQVHWVFPIPVSTTVATNYSGSLSFTQANPGFVCGRLAAFTSAGAFSAGNACVNNDATLAGVISCPANGTIFADVVANGGVGGSATLNQVKFSF